jgi:hypothetical protein
MDDIPDVEIAKMRVDIAARLMAGSLSRRQLSEIDASADDFLQVADRLLLVANQTRRAFFSQYVAEPPIAPRDYHLET